MSTHLHSSLGIQDHETGIWRLLPNLFPDLHGGSGVPRSRRRRTGLGLALHWCLARVKRGGALIEVRWLGAPRNPWILFKTFKRMIMKLLWNDYHNSTIHGFHGYYCGIMKLKLDIYGIVDSTMLVVIYWILLMIDIMGEYGRIWENMGDVLRHDLSPNFCVSHGGHGWGIAFMVVVVSLVPTLAAADGLTKAGKALEIACGYWLLNGKLP